MEELVKGLHEKCAAFLADADLRAEKGNKAAGARARKISLEIEKDLKAFRKVSVK